MRARLTRIILALMIITMVAIAGCGRSKKEPVPPKSPKATMPSTTESAPAELGTAQPAGPFEVTLSTDPASPKVGKVMFIARVTRDAKPVKNAKVTAAVSMPDMGPSTVVLKPSADTYQGTADLSMAGKWKAKVDVSEGKDTGMATYSLTVTE